METKLPILFKALGDDNRLHIMQLLNCGETCGCRIIEKLPISQPTMSYHLNILTESGIIKTLKDGTWKRHTIDCAAIDEMIAFLQSLKDQNGCSCK